MEWGMSNPYAKLDQARDCRAADPQRALDLADRYISENPLDPLGYFSRHLTWRSIEEYNRALDDCNRSLELEQTYDTFLARGMLYRAKGDHARAVADFTRADELDHQEWLTSFGPHFRADSLARLGRLDEALADCDVIPNDHWIPAHSGLPGGNKAEFTAEIRRRAALTSARSAWKPRGEFGE
jgi:tetratricopeptide (TPR) repeat protein